MTGCYGDGDGPLVIPHRTGAGLATENTVRAAHRSLALGHRYLETDARTTRDGVVVAFHDRTVDRLAGVRGAISALTWDELRELRLHDGTRIVRLDTLLNAWPAVRWSIDVKDPATLPALVDVLRTTGATQRVCLAGTRDRWLAAARDELGEGLATALGWESIGRLLGWGRFRLPGYRPSFVHVPYVLVRDGRARRVVDRARGAGLRTVIWGLNDPLAMHRMLDAGVDGLISDRADVLREVMVARGSWVPAVQWSGPGQRRGSAPQTAGTGASSGDAGAAADTSAVSGLAALDRPGGVLRTALS
ncbi:MAG: glycerophosphodiester phosphodiesterase [Actinobacteria bacterium]|nr:glycerophosphodiester phosphodiesterase [Actinomycetota bacterium]